MTIIKTGVSVVPFPAMKIKIRADNTNALVRGTLNGTYTSLRKP